MPVLLALLRASGRLIKGTGKLVKGNGGFATGTFIGYQANDMFSSGEKKLGSIATKIAIAGTVVIVAKIIMDK